MSNKNLLMIPGPIEVSPVVLEAFQNPPPSHVAPDFIEKFGRALEMMRQVWRSGPDSQPFVIAGSGTIAMEMAVCNVLEPGQRALVVNTGYFSDRMAEMLRRRGVQITEVGAAAGSVPSIEGLEQALEARETHAVFATHVDTSTGVRVDAKAIADLARAHDVLSIFDGVCATAAESFEMSDWGADIYLTASQKAVGVPPGLALMVASRRALDARAELSVPPPMSIDFEQWLPIMQAYEARRGSYFSTPATNLVEALHASLDEILGYNYRDLDGVDARMAIHQRSADAMRAAWKSLGLEVFPATPELCANTLSAVMYPDGVDSSVIADIKERGVIVAGGLYPGRKQDYFRVGHMGHVVTLPNELLKTVRAVGEALVEHGHQADVDAAVATAQEHLKKLIESP
jgi:alanine-glyoxylate transaminase/serine-glyoxylate transaminase/serine-pyruvate transaminase